MLVRLETKVTLDVSLIDKLLSGKTDNFTIATNLNTAARTMFLSELCRNGSNVSAELASSTSLLELYTAAREVSPSIPFVENLLKLENCLDDKSVIPQSVTSDELKKCIEAFNTVYQVWVQLLPTSILREIINDLCNISGIKLGHEPSIEEIMYVIGTKGVSTCSM